MLQDEDGGRIGAITYPSQDPLSKTLKSFQVDIAQNPTLADLLNQLRGAKVSVQAGGERLAGTVIGVETRQKPAGQGTPIATPVLNLLSGAMIRAVELQSITSLSLDDPQLQDELTKALAALVQARDQDKKPVTINFTGTGDRRVRIGYVVETPIWKTSYRLMVDPHGKTGRLQGWAIVENQTESDWNNVSLSLVSGRPISFTMDLYQPLYSSRPNVVPQLYAGLHPQVYDAGISGARDSVRMGQGATAGGNARRIGYGPDGRPLPTQLQEVVVTGQSDFAARAMAPPILAASSGVQSVAAAGQLGELFQYTVGNVTLPRQKSAMLPIITDSVDIERVSIYNANVLRTNPLNGVWFKNTTGKHLLQGPLTILEKDAYAGDAQIDNVPPGQSRFVSYGIDLDVAVTTKSIPNSLAITAKINKGELMVTRRNITTMEYAAENKSSKDKELVIEHPVRQDFKLVDTQKPFETTPTTYRFKGVAAANKVTTLAVKEEWLRTDVLAMVSSDVPTLVYYSKNAEISKDVRDAILKAIQLRETVLDLEREANARTQQISEITGEQNRIRENMKTVAPNGQYYERLLSKLNEQESTIEKLQSERSGFITRRDAARKELEDYLGALNVG